jgi:long-chain acyl-CoA synthetase
MSVIGVKDPNSGEVPKAFVVLKKGETMAEKETLDYRSQNLAIFQVPKSVEFRDALLITFIVKVLGRELK